MRAHWRWVLRGAGGITGTVLIAAGIALAASGGTTSAGNRARAQSEAPRLLDLIQLPPNASQSTTEPSGDHRALAAPGYDLASSNLVDAHTWWRVPGNASAVLAYVAAHLPNGARRYTTGGGNIAPGYSGESWSLSPVPGVLSQRVIAVTVLQLDAKTAGVRTDGEAVWIVPRPAWEVIPTGVRKVMVRVVGRVLRGMPFGLRNGSYGLTGAGARRLVNFINHMGLVQPAARMCPAGYSRFVYLRFLSATGRTLARAVEDPTGCGYVRLTVGRRRGPALADYPTVSGELRRLLHQ